MNENIDVRVLSLYLNISKYKGTEYEVLCSFDPDHGQLFANLDNNDRAYLYCLGCDYKFYPGLSTYAMLCSRLRDWGFDA